MHFSILKTKVFWMVFFARAQIKETFWKVYKGIRDHSGTGKPFFAAKIPKRFNMIIKTNAPSTVFIVLNFLKMHVWHKKINTFWTHFFGFRAFERIQNAWFCQRKSMFSNAFSILFLLFLILFLVSKGKVIKSWFQNVKSLFL